MSRNSLRIKRIVSNKHYKNSKFKKILPYDKYKKIMGDLGELMSKEVIDSQEGLFIPELGRFFISKFRMPGKTWMSKIHIGKKMHNLHSFGYIFRCNWQVLKGIRYKRLYKFTAHRYNINRAIIDRIHSGDHNYVKEEWSS